MTKPKKCKCCGVEFTPFKSTQKFIDVSHEKNWLNNTEEGKKELVKRTEKYLADIEKKRLRQAEKNKSAIEWQQKANANWKKFKVQEKKKLVDYEGAAKKEIQKWVRHRDKDLPCISCGVKDTDLWDGGHYKKAEIYSGLIFNENNIHRQCRKCNRYLGGNEANFRNGLVERYGIDYVVELELKANELRNYKYTNEELIEIRKKYSLLNKNI